MSAPSVPVRKRPAARASRGPLIAAVASLVLVAAMAFSTRVVRIGSADDVQNTVFSPQEYGAAEFPDVQEDVVTRAVDAATLAKALTDDRAAATTQYGVAAGAGAVFPVKFTGVAGEAKSGVYAITVEGMGEAPLIRVQTGPAINGTELRDASGKITFGQFKNQIEFQNAGSALNNAMKEAVLTPVDTKALQGKTVSVVGVFKLINPKAWLVTPVRLDVQ